MLKRGDKYLLHDPRFNGGKPFQVTIFKKVRNDDYLVEVLFPHEVGGGGFHKVSRLNLGGKVNP